MLLVRGPSIFPGYLAHTGESPFVTFEGKTWYRTGDLVRQDEDGVLSFEGRLKRFIKLGGEMISLPAIESALQPHFPRRSMTRVPRWRSKRSGMATQQEIVLFTTRAVDRADVNQLAPRGGLQPAVPRAARDRSGSNPGARHGEDGLPHADSAARMSCCRRGFGALSPSQLDNSPENPEQASSAVSRSLGISKQTAV